MKFRLYYVTPDEALVNSGTVKLDEEADWIHGIVASNPDVIFFLTQETTDIWGPPAGHTCLCHDAGDGACSTCKDFGCRVWNFNRITMPKLLLED